MSVKHQLMLFPVHCLTKGSQRCIGRTSSSGVVLNGVLLKKGWKGRGVEVDGEPGVTGARGGSGRGGGGAVPVIYRLN